MTRMITSKIIFAFSYIIVVGSSQLLRAADTDAKSRREDLCKELEIRSEKDSLRILYKWHFGNSFLLVMPKDQLACIKDPAVELRQLFADNNIIAGVNMFDRSPSPWDANGWNQALSVLKVRAENYSIEEMIKKDYGLFEIMRKRVSCNTLKTLLHDAKGILKSFLPKQEIPHIETDFVVKSGNLNRLFTYAMLKQVIHEDGITHVHLPDKVLIVKDKATNSIVSNNEAASVLDSIVNMYANYASHVDINIGYYSKDYVLSIWAERKKNHPIPFTVETSKELVQLTKKAPFDVGCTNIFSDENGDAIIIDTENKGEYAPHSVSKLARYGVPEECIESALADM